MGPKRYDRQERQPDEKPESLLLLQAEIALNQGDLEKALQICEDIVQREPLSVAGHFMLGLVYRSRADEHKAIAEFKKVVFLQPDNALARFNLGDLHSQTGQIDEAKTEYSNAAQLLIERPESFDDRFAGGFSVALLIDICCSKLQTLKKGG
ncbi:MAG: tetratricopeptide repeat protein [Deltaproteobacteria bacterium]|nr:MAG: tetratricopeptide repeat protein [Deltaproteobacteria bacterium]